MRSGEDVEENVGLAERLLGEAADGDADLAALPEVFTYLGSSAGRIAAAEAVPGPTTARLAEIARSRGMWVLGGSVIERSATIDSRRRSCSIVTASWSRRTGRSTCSTWTCPGSRRSGSRRRSRRVSSSSRTRPTSAGIGLSICYDVRFPELYRGLMVMGAEVLFVPAQFQHATGKDHWEVLLRARAIENQCFVVAPGAVGGVRRSGEGSALVRQLDGRRPVGPRAGPRSRGGRRRVVRRPGHDRARRVRQVLPSLQHRRLGLTC